VCRLLVLHRSVCRYESRQKDDRALAGAIKGPSLRTSQVWLQEADCAAAQRLEGKSQAGLPNLRGGEIARTDEAT